MSILIKGMKMPDCWNCPCLDGEYGECNILGKTIKGGNGRRADCPFVELPDHGDLIEREYAIASACSGRIRTLPTTECGENWIRVEEVRQSLKSVPVVIPAERSEE